jgi:phosphatidylcholine synthase
MVMELRSSARKTARPSSSTTTADTATTPPSASPTSPSPAPRRRKYSLHRYVFAWLVHLYTASGLPVNLYAVHEAMYSRRDFGAWILCNWLAIFIDATDGTLARAADVKKVVPGYDGAGLDNIIDYITFAFSPALALCVFEIVPGVPLQMSCVSMILIAAAYQFCQSVAKTDTAFVGFPSYWNILIHYLYYLQAPYQAVVGSIAFCAVLSFVPVHFVYPTRTVVMRKVTLIGSVFWGLAMIAPCLFPGEKWALTALRWSLLYVMYYCALSGILNARR